MQITSYEEMVQAVDQALLRLDAAYRRTKHLRYGQFFLNHADRHIGWNQCYFTEDNFKAREMIRQFLIDNQSPEFLNRILDAIEKNEQTTSH
jgi:hypothetical protein